MLRKLLVPALLCSIPFLLQGCGAQGGATPASGGSTAGGATVTGGAPAVTGGAQASGGKATSSGGATSAGGTATSSSGAATAGGATSASGGAATTGGATAASGGASSAKGGATPANGGSTTVAGGTTSASGGVAVTGGTTSAKGGATAAGGTTATATGGTTATATGGTTGTAAVEVWISPTGSDTNPGTKDLPMLNVCNDDNKVTPPIKAGACYKLCPTGGCSTTGGTIWVMDGTYKYTMTQKLGSSKAGTATNMLNVLAVAGANPVFDFSAMAVASTNRGIELSGNYWHIKGLTVTNAGDSGIHIAGNHNIIESCKVTKSQDTGILIGTLTSNGVVVPDSGSNNTILNCDSYLNNDTTTNGANADGFGAKKPDSGALGAGNVFDGCRSWDNADDGFDFYQWTAPVTVKNSWAFGMGTTTAGSQSNGNGFKMGAKGDNIKHVLSNDFAFDNNQTKGQSTSDKGFTPNGNSASMTCAGCGAWNNKGGNFDSGITVTGQVTAATTTAKAAAAPRKADGSLPDITTL